MEDGMRRESGGSGRGTRPLRRRCPPSGGPRFWYRKVASLGFDVEPQVSRPPWKREFQGPLFPRAPFAARGTPPSGHTGRAYAPPAAPHPRSGLLPTRRQPFLSRPGDTRGQRERRSPGRTEQRAGTGREIALCCPLGGTRFASNSFEQEVQAGGAGPAARTVRTASEPTWDHGLGGSGRDRLGPAYS